MRRAASLPCLLVLVLLAVAAVAPVANAGPQDLVLATGFDQPDRDYVNSMAVKDGRLYIAGGFSSVGPVTGPAGVVSADGGGRPLPFPVLGRAQNFAEAAVDDGHGGWIVGGVVRSRAGLGIHAPAPRRPLRLQRADADRGQGQGLMTTYLLLPAVAAGAQVPQNVR